MMPVRPSRTFGETTGPDSGALWSGYRPRPELLQNHRWKFESKYCAGRPMLGNRERKLDGFQTVQLHCLTRLLGRVVGTLVELILPRARTGRIRMSRNV